MTRFARRALLILATTWIALALASLPAAAMGMSPPTAVGLWDFADLTDTSGVPIDRYRKLDLNEGGLLSVSQKASVFFIQTAWGLYWLPVALTTWFLDFVLEMTWLEVLLTPFEALATTVTTIMSTLGLRGFFIFLLGVTVAIAILRGRIASGIANLGVGALVVGLGVGLLSNPYAAITAADGAIHGARDTGLELAAAINTSGQSVVNPATGPADTALTQSLSTTLLRTPHQLINYGSVIDGGECEAVFDEVVGTEDARARIGDCDSELGDVADNPSNDMLIAAAALQFVLQGFSIFALVLGVLTLAAVLGAAWSGVRLLVDLVLGIATEAGRSTLGRSAARLAFALTMIAATYAFTAAWMFIIADVMSIDSDNPLFSTMPIMARMYFLAVLLILGCIAIIFMRRAIKRGLIAAGSRLASIGSTSRASQEPVKVPLMAKAHRAVGISHDLASLRGKLPGRRPHKTEKPSEPDARAEKAPPVTPKQPPAAPGPVTPKQLPAAPGHGALTPGAPPRGGPSLDPSDRVTARINARKATTKKLLGAAVATGAVVATGGLAAGGAAAAGGTAGSGTAAAKTAGTVAKTARAAKSAGTAGSATTGGLAGSGAAAAGGTAGSGTAAAKTAGSSAKAARTAKSAGSATTTGGEATGTARRATRAAHTVRNDALRAKLSKPEPVNHSHTGDQLRDESTGMSYRTTRVTAPSRSEVEVLVPEREELDSQTPRESTSAPQRLRDRLNRRGRAR